MKRHSSMKDIDIFSDITEPPAKKRKLNNENKDENEGSSILNVTNVRDTILDYLSISDENLSLFINIGDNKYFNRRLFHLNKNDMITIKQNIDDHKSSKTSSEFHVNNLCTFYANVKCLFGDDLFTKLLNIPLSKLYGIHELSASTSLHLDDSCSITKAST